MGMVRRKELRRACDLADEEAAELDRQLNMKGKSISRLFLMTGV